MNLAVKIGSYVGVFALGVVATVVVSKVMADQGGFVVGQFVEEVVEEAAA